MANFFDTPLKAYEANKVTSYELMSQDHYAQNMQKIQERMKFSVANQVVHRMTKMTGTLYVFSEDELKKLLKR